MGTHLPLGINGFLDDPIHGRSHHFKVNLVPHFGPEIECVVRPVHDMFLM